MNLVQLITFAWVCTWVLCDSMMPSIPYADRIQACLIATFAAAYANNAHGELWKRMKKIVKRG